MMIPPAEMDGAGRGLRVNREPNQQDAALYQRCFSQFQSGVAAEARAWFFEHFDATTYANMQSRYPPGSRERHLLAEFLGFYESNGVLVSRGLLHEDVFFDAPFALDLVWGRVGPIIEEWQEATGEPGIWENVAWLGKRYKVWYETHWRPKVEAIPPEEGPI